MSKKHRKRAKRKHAELQQELVPPIVIPDDPAKAVPSVNPSKIYQLFLQGNVSAVCAAIIEVINFYEQHNYRAFGPDSISNLNDFVSVVLALMVNPEFKIPNQFALPLLARSHLFANLVRISSYITTDSVLAHLIRQENNYLKILFLYTALNEHTRIPIEDLFNVDSFHASLWYYNYTIAPIGRVEEHIERNSIDHIANIDERWQLTDQRVTPLYFACTYINDRNGADRRVKSIINAQCKRVVEKQIRVNNVPARDSIAIFTAKWFQNSAVSKAQYPYLERLRDKYRLTLVHLGRKKPETMMVDWFDKVEHVYFQSNGSLNTDCIETNDFQLVYFPDVGMNDESVWLSNVRWAPIQVTNYGHPVTTGDGSEIDYFICGLDAEKLDEVESVYAERVVLIPGIGQCPHRPRYKAVFPPKKSDKVIVNCPWGPDKYNWTILQVLKRISERARRPHQFQFFASQGVNRYQALVPFLSGVHSILGDNVFVHSDKEYYDYMAEMEFGDFAINSFPFGGYNTVVENLYLGKPMISIEGDRMYNKAGPALLRRVGLGELVAQNYDEFIELVVQMINDENFFEKNREILRAVDLDAVLFDTTEPLYFEAAIEYLINNDATLRAEDSRKPIVIDNPALWRNE